MVQEKMIRRSLYREAAEEMRHFQKGLLWGAEQAAEEWNRKHWWKWARKRWLEHIRGKAFWIELGESDFDLVSRGVSDDRDLLERILGKLEEGDENLNIINWAVELGADVDEVVEILEKLNLNERRDDMRDAVS